jgi:hypothetical protein
VNKDNDLYRTKWITVPAGHWVAGGNVQSYCKDPGETDGEYFREHAPGRDGRACVSCGAVWLGPVEWPGDDEVLDG